MVGFSRTRVYVGAKGWFIGLPTRPVKLCERVLDRLGVDAQLTCGCGLYLYSRFQVAAGPTFQSINAPGFIGDNNRTRFNAVPWLTLKLGYQISENARVSVGYDAASLGRMGGVGVTGVALDGNGVPQAVFGRVDRDATIQGFSLGFELLF